MEKPIKDDETSRSATPPSPRSLSDGGVSKELDQAYWFIEQFKDASGQSAVVDLKRVYRKVDWRIVPVMFLCNTSSFIDKLLINYAAVMGLNKDLKLRGNDFSNTATAFYVAYLVAEIPISYALQVVPPGKWLAGNVVLWGIATGCTAATRSYSSLLVVRILLAIFEASIIPAQVIIISQWYIKSDQAQRTAFWWCGLGAGQIIGGFLSWAFQKADHASLASWRIMFLVIGGVTIFIGFAAYFAIPDSPMTAKFLNTDEKVAILKHVAVNQTGVKNKHFKWPHLLEIFKDPQMWMLVVITILDALPSGVVSLYSATLLTNAGFKPDISALLLIPQGISGVAAAIMCGYAVQRASHRWAWLVFLSAMGILGSALMSFLPTSNHAGLLAGIYITSAITPALFLLLQWTAANVAGSTKRSIALPLIAASFSAGSVIAPQTFQAKDAPDYLPAKITTLVSQVVGAALTFALFCYYVWMNRRRERMGGGDGGRGVEGTEQYLWEDLTDLKNPAFRYV